MSHNTRAQHARSVTIDEGTTHRMSPVRLPRRTRTISALALVAGAATLSLAGCTSAGSVDGAYIKIAETSGISSAWVIKGDSIRSSTAVAASTTSTTNRHFSARVSRASPIP